MTKILLFFPIYNEEVQIKSSLLKLVNYGSANLVGYDISYAVVDNASTDKSPEICRELERELPNFRYYRLEEKGRGLALNYIWKNANYDFALYMDVDLSTNLNHVLDSIKQFEDGADITYGSRKSENSVVTGRNFKRILTSWGYVNIVRFLSASKIRDFQCGFKGIRKSAAEKIMPILHDRKWFFDTELLLSAEKMGYKISEVPVEWVDDPESTVRVITDSRNMFESLLNFLYKPSFNVYSESKKTELKNIEFIRYQIIIFLLIGGTSFLIEYLISSLVYMLVFNGNREIFVIPNVVTGYMISAVIGYLISSTYNFSLNKLITFKTRFKNTKKELIKFILVVAFTGLILQNLILYLLVNCLGINVNVSFVMKALIILIINFIIHKKFTFK